MMNDDAVISGPNKHACEGELQSVGRGKEMTEKTTVNHPVVLAIAGSDSCGGAGIQADLKTMMAYGVYGMSVITAVTAQNTCGITAVENMPGELILEQLKAVLEDIQPNAVKIGMLSTVEGCRTVSESIRKYGLHHVILDPVMVSTSGSCLLEDAARTEMFNLFEQVELITPNIPEAEMLTGIQMEYPEDMEQVAQGIYERYGCAVLVKGGHMKEAADDLLYDGQIHWYPAERISCHNPHGTGCALSSAIASGLAWGNSLPEAVGQAKQYVRGAMAAELNLGQGCSLLHHGWSISSATEEIASRSDAE